MEEREPSVGENVNWCSHYEERMEVPKKSKNRATICSSNPTPGHTPRQGGVGWR